MTAQLHNFPIEGFVIGEAHCCAPGPESHLMCLRPAGHAGLHQWNDWQGCHMRLPNGWGTVPFRGFAR